MISNGSGSSARVFARFVAGLILVAGCPTDDPATDGDSTGGIDSISTSPSGSESASDTEASTGPNTTTLSTSMGETESDSTGGETEDDSDSDPTTSDSDPTTEGMETTTAGQVELDFLEVTPGETILEVDLNATATQDFIVTANYTDGTTADVTAEASWSVDNPMIGAMAGNTLNVPAYAMTFFDSGIVTATVDGEEGQAQITIAAYQISGAEPDFFFVLPFNDPAGNQDKPLTFDTDVKAMDVFINMDTSGSMGEEIANLQNALTTTIIPDIQAAVPNTRFGAGAFEDFPISPVGRSDLGDQPFVLLSPISNNVANVQSAVAGMSVVSVQAGGDFPESNLEALYQVATGEGLTGPAPTSVAPHAGGVGGVEFREGAFQPSSRSPMLSLMIRRRTPARAATGPSSTRVAWPRLRTPKRRPSRHSTTSAPALFRSQGAGRPDPATRCPMGSRWPRQLERSFPPKLGTSPGAPPAAVLESAAPDSTEPAYPRPMGRARWCTRFHPMAPVSMRRSAMRWSSSRPTDSSMSAARRAGERPTKPAERSRWVPPLQTSSRP